MAPDCTPEHPGEGLGSGLGHKDQIKNPANSVIYILCSNAYVLIWDITSDNS